MDPGTITLVVVPALVALLAIGMPLGFASAILALVVLIMRFEPTIFTHTECYLWAVCEDIRTGGITGRPGTGPLYLLTQKIFDLMTEYVLISVPLFIFMAALLERSGIAKQMYNALDFWLSRVRGGVAIVTSLMAVLMAAMSGIIGGEVVLLGLIALPQMLRLGYNQNLAIGTICASGSLGTMIPPSIVLIIYGLITETSIKALFTGAFIPGFMLAMMIITYIVIRTQLRPEDAPLPDPDPELERPIEELGVSSMPIFAFGAVAALGLGLVIAFNATDRVEFDPSSVTADLRYEIESTDGDDERLTVAEPLADEAEDLLDDAADLIDDARDLVAEAEAALEIQPTLFEQTKGYRGLIFAAMLLAFACFALTFSAKGQAFNAFVMLLLAGIGVLLLAWTAFLTLSGRNTIPEGEDPYPIGMASHFPVLAGITVFALFMAFVVLGQRRVAIGWEHGKGLVPPLTVIGVVLGSIYGGVTGITEAAGMGAFAVFMIAVLRGEVSVGLLWDSMMRTMRSTGTIIWVTIGAAALAGAYTLAGGPAYIANLISGSGMPTMLILLTMMLILLFMGAFMDWVGIVLLIIPVFLPIVKELPIDEIGYIGQLDPKYISVWFGVLFCMNMQVSFLSPPFGPAAFYLKSVAPPHISLTDIFKGFLPFIGVQLLALSVLLIWPSIVTLWL